MIRTHAFPCSLPKPEADALNQESGRIYSRVMVNHYRVYRQSGEVWLSQYDAMKLTDFYEAQDGQERLLHAHSVDAAQEGFYKACKTAKACKQAGLPNAHYPRKRKFWRTTIWKNSGIRAESGVLLLARARGLEPIRVNLPSQLASLPPKSFVEMRLVWDKASRRYNWHLVVDDGKLAAEPTGTGVMAGDPGEIHPMALTNGVETVVVSARALRAVHQYTNKRLAEIQRLQAAKVKGSRKWKKLQRRKNRFLAQQKRRTRDIEHKVSRAVVDIAVDQQTGTLALGDVRDVADGKRLKAKSQQKIGNWGHGQLRQQIEYKAAAAGITVELVDEAYSSQTCPECRHRHKPKGRLYRCPACGFVAHRDAVGAVNLLSRRLHGEVGRIRPPAETKYRHPFGKLAFRTGKRSRPDTAELAEAGHDGY